MSVIQFMVWGDPKPGGSKKYVGHTKERPGQKARPILVDTAGKGNREWRKAVAEAARVAMVGKELFRGPVRLALEFLMPRPKYHYNTKDRLNASAPYWHTKQPDATKLTRSTEDALKGIVWADDSQVVIQVIYKRYNERGGCQITIEDAEPWTGEE